MGALYSSLGRLHEAIEAYKRALEIRPFMARTHEELSYVYRKLDHVEDAEKEHCLATQLASDREAMRLTAESTQRRFPLKRERVQG